MELSEEELVVTMQGILKYPVLQQGRVLCQWRKQREDKTPRPPVQQEKSETVPSGSRQRSKDEPSAVKCIRKVLLAEGQTKASDTEIVSLSPSAAAAVVKSPHSSSNTAARRHHNEVSEVCPGSEGGFWKPQQLTPRKDDIVKEVVSSCSDSNKRKRSEDRAQSHDLMLPDIPRSTEGRDGSEQVKDRFGRGARHASVWHKCVVAHVSFFDDIRGKKESHYMDVGF